MKMKELYSLACILCFMSCSKPTSGEIEIVKNLYPVQFSLELQKEELPFPSVKSMPDNPIPEPSVPGSGTDDKDINDLCSRIEYIIYQSGESPSLIKHKIYTPDDTDFGIIYDTLPKGNYLVCFLGHNSRTSSLTGTTLAFDTVSDTFFNLLLLEVKPEETINNDINLQRIVSRIEFCATDKAPENLDRMEMQISNYPNRLNLLSGKGLINSSMIQITHSLLPSEIGKENICHSFYTFIPTENQTLQVNLKAIEKKGRLLMERNIPGIAPFANKIIRYTGRLYSQADFDDTFQLSVTGNGEWNGTIEEELPD